MSKQDVAKIRTDATDQPRPDLSVLIPAHNEAPALALLLPELLGLLGLWVDGPNWEIVLTDDGSTDGTLRLVEQFALNEPRLKIIHNPVRSGQSTALALAVNQAAGRWLATLDADGQNDPADIPLLWAEAEKQACEAVLGWRAKRNDGWKTRAVSRLANRVRNRLLGQEIRDTGCSTRLLRADLVAQLPRFEGWHRFLGPMMAAGGAKIVQVPVNHRGREFGRSHYNWRNRGLKVVADLFGVAWLNRRRLNLNQQVDSVGALHRFDIGHDQMGQHGPHRSVSHSPVFAYRDHSTRAEL